MIFVNQNQVGTGLTPRAPAIPDELPAPSFLPSVGAFGRIDLGVLGSAFALDNDVVNALDWLSRPAFEPDPDFDPLPLLKGSKYEEHYLSNFIGVQSEDEARSIMSRIDREEKMRETLHRSGVYGTLGGIAAGVLSPTTLIPIGGWYAVAGKTARIAVRAGEGAVAVGGAVALQESVLQGTQETRPTIDSVFAISAAALLGGALGGAIGGLSKGEANALAARIKEIPATADEEVAAFGKAVSGGAASVAEARGSGALKGALGAEKVMSFQDPLIRLQTSTFAAARNAVRDLAETPLTLAENADGIATTIGGSVETRMKMARGPLAQSLREMDDAYSQYFFGERKRMAAARGTASAMMDRGGGKLTYSQFKEAVWEASINDDIHAIPEVAAAARSIRSRVYDPPKDEAINLGIFDKDVKPEDDVSYAPRVYDTDVIRARRSGFIEILAKHFESKRASLERVVGSLGRKVEEKQFEIDQTKSRVEDELARYRVRSQELRATGAAAKEEAKVAKVGIGQQARAFAKEERAADKAKRNIYREMLADLKRGRPKEKFTNILGFIRGRGGIRLERTDALGGRKFATAYGAEIKGAIDKGAAGRGIISAKGLDPDLMLRLAIDEGFLLPDASLDDLVSAIDDTMKGNHVFSTFDHEAVAAQDFIRRTVTELEREGVDVAKLTPEELMKLMGAEGRAETSAMAKAAREIDQLAERFDAATVRVEDIERLADDLKEMAPELVEAARAGREAGRTAARELRGLERQISEARQFTDLSPAEIRSIADDVTNTILGNSPARILTPKDLVAGPRGPLKERVLRIPTALIRDFVVRDPEVLARLYTDTMSADIGLVKKFGSTDLAEQIAKINDEADAIIARATSPKIKTLEDKVEKLRASQGGNEAISKAIDDIEEAKRAASTKVEAQRRAAIRDLTAIRDRLRGTYALPINPDGLLVRTGRVARNLNYMRLLGGMTLSAVPDLGRPVMVYGLTRTMRTAFHPFVGGLKTFKLAAKETKLAGTGLDMVLDSRVMAIADVMDDYGRGSKFERGIQAATRKFGIVSLMAPWNAAIKQFVGIIGQTKMLQLIEKLEAGKATTKEVEYLAAAGIDANMAHRIWRQFAGGEDVIAVPAANAKGNIDLGGQYIGKHVTTGRTAQVMSWGDSSLYSVLQDGLGPDGRLSLVKAGRALFLGKKLKEGEYEIHATLKIDKGRVEHVVVAPELQRRGLATMLMDRARREFPGIKFDTSADGDFSEAGAALFNRYTASPRRIVTGGHGVKDGAVWWANTGDWTDKQAVEAIRAALVRDVDRVIITPGQDKPLWMSTEMGKLVGQFRAFNIASVQRTMIAGLQQRDMAALNGAMLMLGLGALSYYLKAETAGYAVSADPVKWAAEAFDRSGLAGWLADANNITEKLTRGHIGLSAFTGEQASRYASRNALGALLGPTFDQVGDAIQVLSSGFAGDWSATDSHALRKLAPLQNIFYLRTLLDRVEASVNEAFGIPARKPQGRPARSTIR